MIRAILASGVVLAMAMAVTPAASAGFTPDQHGDVRGGTLRGKVRLSGDTGGAAPVQGGLLRAGTPPGRPAPSCTS